MRLSFEYIRPNLPPVITTAQLNYVELEPEQAAQIVKDYLGDDVEIVEIADSAEAWPVIFYARADNAWLYVHRAGPRLVYSRS